MGDPKILHSVRLIQKCLVLNQDEKILALKRPNTDPSRPGCWDLPGGGYEEGEDLLSSIQREVKEEAGLHLKTAQPIFVGSKIGVKSGLYQGEHTVFAICYQAGSWSGEVVLSAEHTEYRWVAPNELLTFEFGNDGGFFSSSLRAFFDRSSLV